MTIVEWNNGYYSLWYVTSTKTPPEEWGLDEEGMTCDPTIYGPFPTEEVASGWLQHLETSCQSFGPRHGDCVYAPNCELQDGTENEYRIDDVLGSSLDE